jgi:hypothetical protein
MAMKEGGDIIIMDHPDYQNPPKLIPAMTYMIGNGFYNSVLVSIILVGYAMRSGMPSRKYIVNRFPTFVENILLKAKFLKYHTGYRAFSLELLERLPLKVNLPAYRAGLPGKE